MLAVVDGGFDQSHEDLEFLSGGYDAYNDDFTVPVDDHGTHVSGILGAKADNTDGIAGVNWDTRIFPVAGSSTNELVVTRAYDHILGLRQQYNSSGGSQGRYIVATNSSFGVDFGDPDDYQDWCAYYDSLGTHGIVSIAATANLDINVDTAGDVPTGCSSDYLITVTNTDHNDNRNSGAAYGSVSIDLGAPGTSIISTVPAAYGTYISYSGTSMAAPHVTGIVGLIYDVLPSTTITNSFINPGSVALDVIDMVLNNVDQISSMNGITTTGGRLNAYKAVQAAIPQYSNHYFSSSTTTLSSFIELYGSSTIANGAMLTIDDHHTVWVSGSLSSTGSSSSIVVKGRLILEANASLGNIELTVEDGAIFIAEDNTLVDAGGAALTIAGNATLGDNFTMEAASKLELAQTGRLEFTGDAALEFDERSWTIPGGPTLYGPGFFTIHGEVVSSHSSGETITMNNAPGTALGYWNGVTVYNSASGSLERVDIEEASIGVTASSSSTIGLRDITVTAPTTTGFDFNSSDVHAINLFVTDSDGTGMEISGGAPEFTYFEVTGSAQSGVVVSSYADAYTEEGHVSGSGGGGSNAGVWTDNATYTHINGSVGPNSGWDAAAVNSASVWFNGTSWSGAPYTYTYTDGSSTLTIQNQNNPVKAIAQQATGEEYQLLKEWSQRRREDPEGAAGWLEDTQFSLSATLQGVAAILLADYHLAGGDFPQARSVLEELSPEVKSEQAPGALARRTLQVALNGAPDRELAARSLNELGQSDLKPALLEHYRHMAYQRYGYDLDREAVSPKEPVAGATAVEMEISNYPNPFNPVTNIEYTLPARMKVSLAVYDLLGRKVAVLVNREQPAGSYDIPFDATYLSSGIYIYRLEAGSHILTGRMTLIK